MRLSSFAMPRLRYASVLALLLLGAGGIARAGSDIPEPMSALLHWEVHENPDIRDPDTMSRLGGDSATGPEAVPVPVDKSQKQIRYFELPRGEVEVETVGEVRPEIRSMVFAPNNKVRFLVQPDDEIFAREAVGPNAVEKNYPLPIHRSASRSTFVPPELFSYKASTNRTYGQNPDKKYGSRLARNHLEANRWIEDKKFEYGIPVKEPVFLFHKDIAASVRDWSSVIGKKAENYYIPFFTFENDKPLSILALLNNYVRPEDFYNERVAYADGRAQSEWAFKTAIEFLTPHGQQKLLEVDKDFRTTGRVVFRDFGDANLSPDLAHDLNLDISRSKMIRSSKGHEFPIPNFSRPRWSPDSDLDSGIMRHFAQGVMDYREQVGLPHGVRSQISEEYTGYYTLRLKNDDGAKPSRLMERLAAKEFTPRPRNLSVPHDLESLWKQSADLLRERLKGKAPQPEAVNALKAEFARRKQAALSSAGEAGSILRSRLLWAGIDDSALAVKQVASAVNPLEIAEILSRQLSAEEKKPVFMALLKRVAPYSSQYSLPYGRAYDEPFRQLDEWLRSGVTLDPSERKLAVDYLDRKGTYSFAEDVARIYKNAGKLSEEELNHLKEIYRRKTFGDPDCKKMYKALGLQKGLLR